MFGIDSWEMLISLMAGINILGTILWIWMLIDCATKESKEGNTKLIWIIIIVFTSYIGAAIYHFVLRRKRIAGHGQIITN